ncbi:MAG: hypothetical protein CVU50_03055 [Candidatus Cloacimonetes bacterium HGW-Cloacimonetes-3]|nr:MAG: hypothetical protein CVU50_03055 [Candidatus Cloacimonetes bacterium HGW-Cloacimonetes-3]
MNSIKVLDLLTGKSVWKAYCEYKESQWFSRDDMDALKLEKLRKLINHCYINVPYYTAFMKNIGMIPSDVNDLSVLSKFPITTKEIIKENYYGFTPLNLKLIKGNKSGQTGGTTGNILIKRNDAATRSSGWGAYKRFEDWMGKEPSDKMLLYWGGVAKGSARERIVGLISSYLNKTITFSPENLTVEQAQRIYHALNRLDVRYIRTYSQAAFELAKTFHDLGLKFKLKGVTTTAEPVQAEHRELIRQVFSCEIFDQYGCGEIGGVAFECDHHKGLHITEERVIVEAGVGRELLMTDLDNFSMPFIRYANDDEAEFSEEECTCGRKSRLLKSILGRTSDYLYLYNGKKVHWGLFLHLLFDTGVAKNSNMKKFQIRQDSPDSLAIRMISDPLTSFDKAKICTYIKDNIGDLSIEFIQEKEIENAPSGKYRPVVRNF